MLAYAQPESLSKQPRATQKSLPPLPNVVSNSHCRFQRLLFSVSANLDRNFIADFALSDHDLKFLKSFNPLITHAQNYVPSFHPCSCGSLAGHHRRDRTAIFGVGSVLSL